MIMIVGVNGGGKTTSLGKDRIEMAICVTRMKISRGVGGNAMQF